MFKTFRKFSLKFQVGVFLIIASLILGKLTNLALFFYFEDHFIRWTSIIVYLISWPMLIVGGWWVGKEYYEKIQKYMSYKYYQESIKKGTKEAINQTKKIGVGVKNKISQTIIKNHQKDKHHNK